MSVRSHIKTTQPNFTKFSVCDRLQLWLGPPLTTVVYVMYVQFCGRHQLRLYNKVNRVSFCLLPARLLKSCARILITFHSPRYCMWHWQYLLEYRAGACSHKSPTYSPGGVTHGSKLCTRSVNDDDMQGAVIG